MGKTAHATAPQPGAISLDRARALVDMLGKLKASASDIEREAKAARRELIKLVGTNTQIEGADYRAAISHQVRETLDMEAVREKLSPQFISAHTKATEYDRVDISARTGDEAKAAE
jgi:hypothetical protein